MQREASTPPPTVRLFDERHESWPLFAGTTADLIFVVDQDGQYVDVLAFHGDPLGRQAEEIKSRHVGDFLPHTVAASIVASIREAIRLRTPQLLEYPLSPAHDAPWFEGHATPLIDAQGQCSRVLWVAHDITKRRGMEESLRRTQGDLEERVRHRTAELARAQMQLRCEIAERHRTETRLLEEQRLLQQMLQTYERHRQFMARELHTALGNVERSLQSQGQAEQAVSPEHALQQFQTCLQETRQTLERLHPALLHTQGLQAAIEHLVRQSNHVQAAQVSLAYDLPSPRLFAPLETAIFRLIQESLAIFLYHRPGARLELSLQQSEDQLRIRFEDREGSSDWGERGGERLAKLRERAECFDGKVTLDSTPAGRVRLSIILPLVAPWDEY